MRIMALHAIADCGRMDRLSGLNLLFVVAAETESLRCRSRQLDASDIAVHPDFVATHTAGRDRRVNGLPFALILVALETLFRIDIFVERNRVSLGDGWQNRNRHHNSQQRESLGEGLPGYGRAISDSLGPCHLSFCTTLSVSEPNPTVSVENCK